MTISGGALEASITVQTNATGNYTAQILPATYSVTAGPLLPGYPTSNSVAGQVVTASNTTNVPDIALVGVPNLIYNSVAINDTGGNGNGNGYPDPGETGVQLSVSLTNNGAATSTGISAVLSTTTPGVTVTQNTSAYPNIAAAGSAPNTTAYVISLSPSLVCGTVMQFNLAVTTAQGPYNFPFSITASIPQPPASAFFDNFENGINGWTTGGTGNAWGQTTTQSYSPTHSWTDSPAGNYANDVNSWLQTPAINLAGKTGISVSAYSIYGLEPGFDFVFLEWSIDGGTTFNATPLATFNATEDTWTQTISAASPLNNQANVRLRYRFTSDGGVVDDGFYVDNFDVSYQPIVCAPPIPTAVTLSNLSASDSQPTAPYGALLAVLAASLAAGAAIVLRKRAVSEQ